MRQRPTNGAVAAGRATLTAEQAEETNWHHEEDTEIEDIADTKIKEPAGVAAVDSVVNYLKALSC